MKVAPPTSTTIQPTSPQTSASRSGNANRRRRTHLTLVEVAERWNVSVNFVRREIWRGNIKCTRFGRSIRVPVGEAERYAESCTKREQF